MKTFKEILEKKINLDDLISQVSKKTSVKNIKKLYTITTPNDFEKIRDKIQKIHKKKPFTDWEDLENFMANNFSWKDYDK